MLQNINNNYNAVTASERRAGAGIDIVYVIDRYGLTLSAARVLQVIDHLVYASRLNGVKDKRGIPYCYASKEWIAGKIGKSLRTVARAIHDLKAAGIIECRRTRNNAMLFITGYEVYGAAEDGCGTAAATAAATAAETTATETAAGRVASGPCHAPETAMNGTSCGEASGACFAMNGTSGTATNGTSNNNIPSYRQSHNPSIDLTSRADRSEKWRIFDELKTRIIDAGHIGIEDEEYGACMAMLETIADVVASNGNIRISGGSLTADQYWDMVRNIKGGESLRSMLRDVAARDRLGQIRNKRAYLLASVYNCAVWDGFSGINVREDEKERMASGHVGREWKNPALNYAQHEYQDEEFGPDSGFWVDLDEYGDDCDQMTDERGRGA